VDWLELLVVRRGGGEFKSEDDRRSYTP
jgi:hypothetical protein